MIIRPLTDLLKKDAVFKWAKVEQDAFDLVKARLSSEPILCVYNPKAKTELHTDASKVGLGGVLYQEQRDKKLHPISYFSRKTTPEKSKYHSYELEALAIVCSVERFRVYLIGIDFIIRTDCNSLKLLEHKRDLNPRIGRWFIRLSEYQYKIEYHTGSINVVADALSRFPVEDSVDMEVVGLPIMHINISTDWVAAMQRTDPEIISIVKQLESGDANAHAKFTLCKGRVYRISKNKYRLFVPSDLKYDIVSEAHRDSNHLGVDKTLEKIKECYYFPKLRDFVDQYVKRCVSCLYHKTSSDRTARCIHPLDKGDTCFHTIHMDHLGPFVKTDCHNKYVLGLIDGFSKYVVLKAVKDTSAFETVNFLQCFICNYGKPTRVITDRGTAFTAHLFEEFCKRHAIIHIKVAAGTPRGNGQIEQLNKTILNCLSTGRDCESEDRCWDEKLFDVQWSLNNSVHRVTKCTPFELVFKHKAIGLHDSPLTLEIKHLNSELSKEDQANNDVVTDLLEKNRIRQLEKCDMNVTKSKLELGDIVMVKTQPVSSGESRKLEPKYRGPYNITKVLDKDRYIVEDIEGEQQSGRLYKSILSSDRLKLVSKANVEK